MATPLKERPKVLIPLPPLPEFYQNATEGDAMAAPASSSSSHAKKTAKSPNNRKTVVATVEVRTKAKADSHPPATPGLPPAKPLSFESVADAKPTLSHGHSLPPPPVKLPPFPPPPPPPGFELDCDEDMTHRYSYHHCHTSKHPVYEAKPTRDSQPQATRVITIPPPPPGFPGILVEAEPVAQPTLTVYHVCRICLRPRSEKYHLEHPISSDVLPPSGICKHCRITNVEEKHDYTKLVHIEESDKVTVGISAFLPKDNLYTRQEASEAIRKQQRKGYSDLHVRQPSPEEEEDDDEQVVYRYMERTKKSVPDPPPFEHPEVSVENLAAMNLMNDMSSPRLDTRRTTMKVNVGSDYDDSPGDGTVRYAAPNVRVAEIRRVERVASPDAASSSKSTKSSASSAKDQGASSAKASVFVKSSAASNRSTVKATAQVTTPTAPGYTESEIRTFARDEVERYRQAERMVHSHPNAYAHGEMVPVVTAVPVERRIEAVRDTAAPKPWEVPTSPPREAAFATLRTRATSVSSKEGTGRMKRGPSESSKHWCRPAKSSSSGTKSISSTASTSTVKEQSSRRYGGHVSSGQNEYDEVIIQHKRRTEAPRGLPESDPPTGVKLKEVVGMIREEPAYGKRSSASSGRRYEQDIIEVTEEIELPPGAELRAASIRPTDTATSQRVKILRAGQEPRQQQRTMRSSQDDRQPSNGREGSLRTDKSYWEAERVVRTASGHSSARKEESDARGSERQSQAEADVVVEEREDVYATQSPRQFRPNPSSHGRSDDDSWYASRVKSVRTHQLIPEWPSSPPKPQEDVDDKTVWHRDEIPIRPAASSRMSTVEDAEDDNEDWDWEYRKRIVTTSDRPPGRIDDERAPGRHYVDTERLFRRRRPSESGAHEQEPSTHSSHTQERLHPRAPPIPEIVISTEVDQESHQDRGRGPYVRNSEESAHVRFASKVEFSPTPPGSNESLPEQIRQSKPSSRSSRGSGKRSSLRNQIDGGASEPPESAESLLADYETTRSLRRLAINGEDSISYVSAKHASSARGSAHSGSAAQKSTRSEPRSFRSQGSRHSARTREDDGFAQAPSHNEDERRSGRSAQRSSRDETEIATQLSRSRRLARAFSESPSRERLQQEYARVQQQREEKSETVISRGKQSDWDEAEVEVDGKGPYREQSPRTESMDALYGSGHGGPKSKRREYVVREKW
jgi:hypothetical protein